MMLAGVTGIKRSSVLTGAMVELNMPLELDSSPGWAGGGIERSTGDGVSPVTSGLDGLVAGVELADLDPRIDFFAIVAVGLRLRLGFSLDSSSLGEAVRLFEFDDEATGGCGYASSHGLVSGETSKSISVGSGLMWNAMLAGAELDKC